MTELDSVVDLELTLTLTPLCEDPHEAFGDEQPPGCGTFAIARMHFRCDSHVELICKPLRDWALAPPAARCSSCDSWDCLEILPL